MKYLPLIILLAAFTACKVKQKSESTYSHKLEVKQEAITLKGLDYRQDFTITQLQELPEDLPILVTDPQNPRVIATATRKGDSIKFKLITPDTTVTPTRSRLEVESTNLKTKEVKRVGLPTWVLFAGIGFFMLILLVWKLWKRN